MNREDQVTQRVFAVQQGQAEYTQVTTVMKAKWEERRQQNRRPLKHFQETTYQDLKEEIKQGEESDSRRINPQDASQQLGNHKGRREYTRWERRQNTKRPRGPVHI